jgi:hypothetical protein
MKKYSLLSIILLAGLLLMNGCEKDYLSKKKVVIEGPVSFSENVNPIFTEDCALPTCHVTGGQTPDLTASKAYDQLTQLGYVDTANAEESLLYKRITATVKPMPPSTPLSAEEIGYILAWIEQGAQNN